MASSKKTTASLFSNMSSITNAAETIENVKEEITENKEIEPSIEVSVKESKETKAVEVTKKDIDQSTNKKTVSFTTPGIIKDKLQRYSIAFPDSISQYITDLIIADFKENEEKYEEIANLLEKVKMRK